MISKQGAIIALSALSLGGTDQSVHAESLAPVPPVLSFRTIPALPGGNGQSFGLGISGDGSTVIGRSEQQSEKGEIGQIGFVWTEADGVVSLGDLPGGSFSSKPQAISANGSVIVGLSFKGFETSNSGRAFRWTRDGGMEDLGTIVDSPEEPGFSNAWGISPSGEHIVGTAASFSGFDAFRWTRSGGMESVGGFEGRTISADGSVVAGIESGPVSGGFQAFRWTEEEGVQPLGVVSGVPGFSEPTAMTPDGSVIVGHSTSIAAGTGNSEAFMWTQQTGMIGLGSPSVTSAGLHSQAKAISSDGSMIVGNYVPVPDNGDSAFIWTLDDGMRDLNEYVRLDLGFDLGEWDLITAAGISADGRTITGTALSSEGVVEAYVLRIPSPTTGSLCALAACMCCRHRRVRRG